MFTSKITLLLAVLATATPIAAYNPYASQDGLYAREYNDDLYIRDIEDYEFAMQKREAVNNYLEARDELENLLYARTKGAQGSVAQDERQAAGAQNSLGKDRGQMSKLKAEEKQIEGKEKKDASKIKGDKGTVQKDNAKLKGALNAKKGKRSYDFFEYDF